MKTTVKAIYRKGVFVPTTECDFPEDTEVEVSRRRPRIIPAEITDPEEKKRHLQAVVARMQENPIPLDAPRFTREDLHERR